MTVNSKAFPVASGLEGMNKLAMLLNSSGLAGAWHFGRGSRFDQTLVNIDFDNATDPPMAWRHFVDAQPRG